MKKWMTVILSICVMVLMFGGDVFAHSESDSKDEDTGLYYYDEDDKITITGYDGSAKDLVIPETIDGKPVKIIGNCAFEGCTNLESIEIPNSVISIYTSAFLECSNLKSVNIPDGAKCIEAYTFYGCSSLKSIEIPDGVTSIEDHAFRKCSSLESIDIPNSVTSIGEQVFDRCEKLTNIKLSNKLESIGLGAFEYCSSLSSIEIPDSVTSIGVEVFGGCENLKNIKLSNKLESIGLGAFKGCSNLSSIEIPYSVTNIGKEAFVGCENTIFYVTEGSYAEQYLKNNNIDYYYTEYYPEDLNVELDITNNTGMFKAVTASVEVKDGSAFLIMALAGVGYHELFKGTYEQAVANGNDTDNWIHGYTNDAGKWEFRIPLPNGKTFVPLVAISESYYQKYLNGQNSLERAFYPRYVKVDIDAATLETGDYEYTADLAVTNYEDGFNLTGAALTTIGGPNSNNYKCQLELTMEDDTYDKVFIGAVDEITEDSETIGIGEGGLFAIPVKWVETFGQPETMKNLLAKPFVLSFYSTNDEQWHIFYFWVDEDESTLEIGENIFVKYNYNYSEVSDGIRIDKYKGSDKNVIIPDTIDGKPVTKIGNLAFVNCSNLKSIEIPDGVTSIGDSAFSNCSSLESIEIPSSVTSIGDVAFSNCSSLKSIEIPDGITSIGVYEFFYCSSLESIEIPDGVTSIGNSAFWFCSSLESIEIPNSVTSIDYGAFAYCSSLESIKIPDSVISIGEDAFYGCDNAKFYIVKGSYVEEYLKENNLEYEYYLIPEEPTETPTEKKSEPPTVSPDNNKTKAPAKVNLKSAKNLKGKKIKAIWKKVTGAKGYEVQYSTNKKFKKAKIKTTKKTTFVIKKLKKKKTYYVRVRAYTIDASGKKVPGKWSKVKKVKVTK